MTDVELAAFTALLNLATDSAESDILFDIVGEELGKRGFLEWEDKEESMPVGKSHRRVMEQG